MLDNLRESANQSPFFQENQTPPEQKTPQGRRRASTPGTFLGLTPVQRFILALMLFMMVCVLGSFLLIATEKIF